MKKLFLMLMLCAPMTLFAQKFGHLDSQALLQSLPEATAVQSKLEAKGKEYQKTCRLNCSVKPRLMTKQRAQ